MGIFPSVLRLSSKYGPESDFWYNRVVAPTDAGIDVNEQVALTYLTVFACISLIAGDVARLPLNLYRKRKDGGKDTITDHALYDILHNVPNPEVTSFNYREAKQGQLLLWGNTFDFIERDKQGRVRALWIIEDPNKVKVFRSKSGEIAYQYKRADGTEVTRTRYEIFHIPGFGFNGLYGKSMITIARESIAVGLAAEKYGSRFFGSGTHPSGILSLPPEVELGEEEDAYNKSIKEQYAGLGKSHSVMILKNGETYQALNMSMEDAQFLETRDHQKVEICGMYHVPPHKIALHGANSNYNNLEQENAAYVDSCLVRWLTRWESCISQQLLTEAERRSGLFLEFLVDGLLRGDAQARATHYNKMFQIGAITPNEIRAKENMNPLDVPEADSSFVMLNLGKLEDSLSIGDLDSQPPPGKQVEEQPEAKQLYRDFFTRTLPSRQTVIVRDRIAKRYAPLIRDAAQNIVNREAKAIKNRIHARDIDSYDISLFLDEFYEKFPEYIERKMGPVIRSFMNAVGDHTRTEIGLTDDTVIDNSIEQYIQTYAARYIGSSKGQMMALLESGLEAMEQRADEWIEKRANKVVADETVRASNAAYSMIAFAIGLTIRWQIRGSKTCPYCQTLNGKRIGSTDFFVTKGSEITPDGDDTTTMKQYSNKRHPPLHQGCDCYVTIG